MVLDRCFNDHGVLQGCNNVGRGQKERIIQNMFLGKLEFKEKGAEYIVNMYSQINIL